MDKLKEWIIEVAVKKMWPSAIRGAILGIVGWMVVRNDILAPFGITSDAIQHTTTIYWDKLQTALIVGLPAAVAAIIKLLNHHADSLFTQTVKPESTTPVVPK
jgi:hypothetical protein